MTATPETTGRSELVAFPRTCLRPPAHIMDVNIPVQIQVFPRTSMIKRTSSAFGTKDDYDRSHSAVEKGVVAIPLELKVILPRNSVDHTLRNPALPTHKPRYRAAVNHDTTKAQTIVSVLSLNRSLSH